MSDEEGDPSTLGDSEPTSLRLTGTHTPLALVQARSTGKVRGKALAMVVSR